MKVSIITPTWFRHTLLVDRCIPSVRALNWPDVEHIVISDGPDPELVDIMAEVAPEVIHIQLPEHGRGRVDYGSRCRNAGLEHATGDVIAYLDDDNAFRPEHLELAVAALADVDFVYTQMVRHPWEDVIGSEPPRHGSVDTSIIVHHRGLPQRCGMWPLPPELQYDKAPDWGVVDRWLQAGATWVHVPHITVDYHFAT